MLVDNLPEWVDARVQISDNPRLASLAGLESLARVEGDLVVSDNPKLSSLEGLGGLERTAGSVVIEANAALQSTSMPTLRLVFGPLEVRSNETLPELGPFAPGGRVGGLVLIDNPALVSAEGVEGWSVLDTLQLRRLPRLEKIPQLSFPTDFVSESNSLDSLAVEQCDTLIDVAGLRRLTIGAGITIQDNAALASLHGLEALENAVLAIRGNPALNSLAALDASRDGALLGAALDITDNPELAACEAESVAESLQPGSTVSLENNTGEGICTWLR